MQEALAGRINPSDVLWQRLETAHGWVLVLDNADDLAALATGDREAGDGAGWLRPTRAGLVVVTSRTSDQHPWGPLARMHRVGPLDDQDGGRVLTDLAPGAGGAADARVLAGRLGGLPLALHQAGSYLRSPFAGEQTFIGYGQALAERFGELLGRGADDWETVTGTWELSLDALAAQGRWQARALLRMLSCFAAGVPVPPVLLDPAMLGGVYGGRAGTEDGLSGLLAVGLIDTLGLGQKGARPQVVVHPLVAETIRHQTADTLADSFAAAADVLGAAISRLDYEDPRDRAGWLALLPHLRALLGLQAAAPPEVLAGLAQAAAAMSEALLWGGSYLASLEIAESALQRAVALGGDHERILDLHSQRASARLFLGQAGEAGAGFRQVLDARLRVLGPDHPDTLATRYNIANVLAHQGKAAEAEAGFRQVLDAELRILGPDHHSTLTTRHEIARMLRYQGSSRRPRPNTGRFSRRKCGSWAPITLATCHNIANVLAALGRFAEAEAGFRQVLDAGLRVLGPNHPDMLSTRSEIARVLAAQGKPAEAEPENHQALDAKERGAGPDPPS